LPLALPPRRAPANLARRHRHRIHHAQFALISGHQLPVAFLWAVIASVGGATVLSYATLAEYFPKESAGQANGALNILHIGGACFIQYANRVL
jgi:hypothetical protein